MPVLNNTHKHVTEMPKRRNRYKTQRPGRSQEKTLITVGACQQQYRVPNELVHAVERMLAPYIKGSKAGVAENDRLPPYAQQLRKLRRKQGYTQQELAKRLSVAQANLSAIENGRRAIGKGLAKRLAAELSVDYKLFL